MRYRQIDVRIWGDSKFRTLSPLQLSGQALFIYLLTNRHITSIPGLYSLGIAAMAEELGWELKALREAFQEVLSQGLVKADFEMRVIFIPNAIKFNKPQSPNVIRSWASHWDEIPECELKNLAYQSLKAFVEGLGEGFAKAFDESIGKAYRKAMPNQEQEQEQEQKEYKEYIVVSDADSDSVTQTHTQTNCPHEAIIALYHEIFPMLRKMKVWNKTRRNYLQQRWREKSEHQSLDFWRQFFEYVKKSKFLMHGNNGDPQSWLDLEWIIKPNNFAKVIEGKYDGE